MLYPALSNYWNSKTQSMAIVDYEAMLEALNNKDFTEIFEKAEKYNASLSALDYPLTEYEQVDGYFDALNLNTGGMMGYVTIGKIGVELPLYHGTSDGVLSSAIGHLQGTSLPTGGTGTHTVVSAHRGLPSAKLFTDLDKLEEGDTFTVTVLDRTLTYQVDRIRIVKPDDSSLLQIDPKGDYCTLLTCTPYGVNTERLLVRGRRIETIEHKTIYVVNDCYRVDVMVVAPIVALPILFVLMMIVLFKPPKKDDEED